MRLYFCNPHTSIGQTIFSVLTRNKHYTKYDFLLNLLNDPYNGGILIDGTSSSLTAGSTKLKFISDQYWIIKIISWFEIYIWCILNKVNIFRTRILFSTKNLDKRNDILLGFAFLNDTFINQSIFQYSAFKKYEGKKILHASHYYSRTDTVSKLIHFTATARMIAEANLKNSSYFTKYFPFIKKVIVVPFTLNSQHKSLRSFDMRINKCLVAGTLMKLDKNKQEFQSYASFYKTDTLHFMRKKIFEHKNLLKNEIVCKIYSEKISNPNNTLPRMLELFKNILMPRPNTYYSLDIVSEYNNYKMVIAPEENIGLPTITFIEAMACGCAFIGLKHSMYSDLGMKDKIHYIAYDGTIENLKKKINYYQRHKSELKKIAANGHEFARKRFDKHRVLSDFWNELIQLNNNETI